MIFFCTAQCLPSLLPLLKMTMQFITSSIISLLLLLSCHTACKHVRRIKYLNGRIVCPVSLSLSFLSVVLYYSHLCCVCVSPAFESRKNCSSLCLKKRQRVEEHKKEKREPPA